MAHVSEYEVETLFIDRLESIGYEYIELKNYDDVVQNFREQLTKFNADALKEAKSEATLSDAEFDRVMIYMENNTVYESAKILRDKYVLTLDNGSTVYLDFFGTNTDRNIYQVTHQVTMDKAHKDDVVYKNRYDVTILINGLPLIQIELKRPGVEINEAINQINRYRKFSFKGLFHFIQIFVVSNSVQTKYFCNENEMSGGEYQPILKSLVFFWTDEKNRRINKLQEFTGDFLKRTTITDILGRYMVIRTTDPVLMVMRPYQIFAVKAAKKRVLEANQNGYVFACTGSGKTLTSFKLAQILRDEPRIDKVIFLVDRKDLDDQTVDEYNAFEKDCVDTSTSTRVLVSQLKDDNRKMVVTTIQKMSNAVSSERYEKLMDSFRDRKVVFIIDECHRSQFGKMHGVIEKHFHNANYIGFTGTPIFEENKGAAGMTTADIFYAGEKLDPCLHRYMIKDAIADGNVLRFSVEFQRTIMTKSGGYDQDLIEDPEYCRDHGIDLEAVYHDDKRIQKVAEDIFKNHDNHTRTGADVYTSIFAVDSIKTLGKYYDVFKELNEQRPPAKRRKVAAIFTYAANEDMDSGADEHSQELLSRCMDDYNEVFGTAFTTETFAAYRKDVAKRMKQKELPQIDILLVVDMMLTGFDAKPLNTLYLDKNLAWHGLLQAYSRTNRVDKRTKQFGKIVSYRNIKKAQDDALRLFSGGGDPNEYLLESYEYYVNRWMSQTEVLRKVVPIADDAGQLKNEDEIRMFIFAFRSLAGTLATLKTFSKFDWADLEIALGEEEYDAYKSWYLYYYEMRTTEDGGGGKDGDQGFAMDIDFDIELVRTDRINVVYILNLLKSVHKDKAKKETNKEEDLDLVLREIERSDNELLRKKKDILIDFINDVFYDLPANADVEHEFEQYEKKRLDQEITNFADENDMEVADVRSIFSDYSFGKTITDENIRQRLSKYHLGLIKVTKLTSAIRKFIENTYDRFRAEGDN
jgi:type I restriction enzyme R subunit